MDENYFFGGTYHGKREDAVAAARAKHGPVRVHVVRVDEAHAPEADPDANLWWNALRTGPFHYLATPLAMRSVSVVVDDATLAHFAKLPGWSAHPLTVTTE